MPKLNLTGAYGVPSTPSPAVRAHPERAVVFGRWLLLSWLVRLAIVGALTFALLYGTHLV